ncbi:hypothetical protein AcW1_006779 [Taiwanofungus camphoratus]|nr:hypothetical protein AcW2_005544 [Antrodia cinnamomea]KAI0953882.1 hypothetical protein AcV7_007287 [Antrodia cinnamomea]KAI0955094.1 hypothetical protein AcW1_006779 [Antrodia cinnamomea]
MTQNREIAFIEIPPNAYATLTEICISDVPPDRLRPQIGSFFLQILCTRRVYKYSYVAVAHASRLFSKYPDCCSLIKRPISRLYSIPKDHHRLSINFLASATHSDHQPAFHTSGFTRQLCSPAGRRTQREHPYSAGPASVQASSNYPHNCTRSYRLEIVQHPVKSAEFGNSTLTRLPLAPPLVAQLVPDQSEHGAVEETELPFLIAHLSLLTSDGSASLDIASATGGQASPQRLLYGNLVSSPHMLRNLQGREGVYFLFPDVSVRWRGRFQLNVTLIKLPRFDSPGIANMHCGGIVLTQARSLPFDVTPRRDYVAPAQTPLTQYFFQQGARMTPSRAVRHL